MNAALFVLAILAQDPSASDRDKLEVARAFADKCGEVTIKGDCEGLIDLTHPALVEAAGGRKAMLRTLTDGMKKFKADGFEITSMTAERPAKLYSSGNELYCVVPTTQIIVKKDEGRATKKGFMLAISDDDGKTWKFLDGQAGEGPLRKLVPQISSGVQFPKVEKAKVERLK